MLNIPYCAKIVKYFTTPFQRLLFVCILVFSLNVQTEASNSLRIIVLSKITIDGNEQDSTTIDTLARNSFKENGYRVLNLDTSLQAQKAAFSDSIKSGLVPDTLSTLNVDVIQSLYLNCSKNTDTILNANIKSYSCILSSTTIRMDSGDTLFNKVFNWTAHGLSANMALQFLIENKIPSSLKETAQTIKSNWNVNSNQDWNIDLVVTGLANRHQTEQIEKQLKLFPGVSQVRQPVFNRELAKFIIEGNGPAAFRKFPETLEANSVIALRIVYQTESVIHAEYDFAKAFRVPISVYVNLQNRPKQKRSDDLLYNHGREIVKSSLFNLEYFNIFNVNVVTNKPAMDQNNRKKLAQKARTTHTKLVLILNLIRKDRWTATFDLIGVRGMQSLITATATDPDPLVSIDKAVRILDKRYRESFETLKIKNELQLSKVDTEKAFNQGVVVDSFEVGQIFPSRLPYYRNNGLGLMKLRNNTDKSIRENRVTFKIGDTVTATQKVEDIPQGQTYTINIGLDALPQKNFGANKYLQMSASIVYKTGGSYGKIDEYTPIVLHSPDTIDWSVPESVASFILPNDEVIKNLAIESCSNKTYDPIYANLQKASSVYSGLWHKPLRYLVDPVDTSFHSSLDTVKFPGQTLESLSGDCDDLTVLLASLFESIGIPTAIIITPGHVLLGIDTGALKGGHILFNRRRTDFVNVDGALFIPVEATAIGKSFNEAWNSGVTAIKNADDKIVVFRTRQAWKTYPSASPEVNKTKNVKLHSRKEKLDEVLTLVKFKTNGIGNTCQFDSNLVDNMPPINESEIDERNCPLIDANMTWLVGDSIQGQMKALDLCQDGVPEACYNLSVMLTIDKTDNSDSDTISRAFDVAISQLDSNVVSMLLDKGGLGLGDESSAKAKARRRINEYLKKAKNQLKKKKKDGKDIPKITISPTGGRKGKPLMMEPQQASFYLFWAQIDVQR